MMHISINHPMKSIFVVITTKYWIYYKIIYILMIENK